MNRPEDFAAALTWAWSGADTAAHLRAYRTGSFVTKCGLRILGVFTCLNLPVAVICPKCWGTGRA